MSEEQISREHHHNDDAEYGPVHGLPWRCVNHRRGDEQWSEVFAHDGRVVARLSGPHSARDAIAIVHGVNASTR